MQKQLILLQSSAYLGDNATFFELLFKRLFLKKNVGL